MVIIELFPDFFFFLGGGGAVGRGFEGNQPSDLPHNWEWMSQWAQSPLASCSQNFLAYKRISLIKLPEQIGMLGDTGTTAMSKYYHNKYNIERFLKMHFILCHLQHVLKWLTYQTESCCAKQQ